MISLHVLASLVGIVYYFVLLVLLCPRSALPFFYLALAGLYSAIVTSPNFTLSLHSSSCVFPRYIQVSWSHIGICTYIVSSL